MLYYFASDSFGLFSNIQLLLFYVRMRMCAFISSEQYQMALHKKQSAGSYFLSFPALRHNQTVDDVEKQCLG